MANAKAKVFVGTVSAVTAALTTWLGTNKILFGLEIEARGSDNITVTVSGDNSGAGGAFQIVQGTPAAVQTAIDAFVVGKADIFLSTHTFGVNAVIAIMSA